MGARKCLALFPLGTFVSLPLGHPPVLAAGGNEGRGAQVLGSLPLGPNPFGTPLPACDGRETNRQRQGLVTEISAAPRGHRKKDPPSAAAAGHYITPLSAEPNSPSVLLGSGLLSRTPSTGFPGLA